MNRSRIVQIVLMAAMVVAPLVSMFLVGSATGTSVFSIDAWNTSWNDERHYYTTVQQMRLFGQPQGVAGYNEVPAARASYGPYSVVTYLPYFLGSFATGVTSHNFMYAINVGLCVLAALAVVLVLRPTVRQAALCAAFGLFQFVIARYACSGMTEASYLLFATLFGSCVLWLALCGDGVCGSDGRLDADEGLPDAAPRRRVVAAYVAAIAACGFWGAMRPFLLAFLLVPVALLAFGKAGLPRAARVVLAVFALVAGAASLASYLYVAKFYATPYFGDSSTLDLLASLMAGGLGEFARLHGHFVLACARSLLTLHWAGIFTLLFALGWALLLFAAIRLRRTGLRHAFVLAVALLVAGALVLEANVLLYSAARIHRMLIAVDVVYALALIWVAPLAHAVRGSHGKRAQGEGRSPLSLTYVLVSSVLCVASLALAPGEFAYPQAVDAPAAAASPAAADDQAVADEQAAAAALAEAMPQAADPWDNTVAHPVETSGLQLYFCMPAYLNVNGCTKGYVEEALANGTFKSKYLALPEKSALNAAAAQAGETVYEGFGHIVYRLR